MTIRYEEFAAGKRPSLQFAKDRVLILGWSVQRTTVHTLEDGTEITEASEMLYALHPDGRVRCTGWLAPTVHFNLKGRKWHDVGGPVPADADFIGQYKPDMF